MKLASLQTQKQILTPYMQQSMGILMLPHYELCAVVEEELQENPLLEIKPPNKQSVEDLDFHSRLHRFETIAKNQRFNQDERLIDDDDFVDSTAISQMSFTEHLIKQLHLETIDPLERKIGEYIIANLDDNGYLLLSNTDILAHFKLDTPTALEKTLTILHHIEPVGIAARSLKECLLLQLNTIDHPKKILAQTIIIDYFHELATRKYHTISVQLNVSEEDIDEATALIASLDPYPAKNFQYHDDNVYIQPDAVIIKEAASGLLKVILNRRQIPQLRINQFYCSLLKRPNISLEEKQFIKEKLNRAMNFIKGIQLRGNTLLKTTEYILENQQEFFKGNTTHLEPMLIKDIAKSLRRSESTISRAISNKFVDTPVGLFPYKYFFSTRVNQENNQEVSSHSIKEEIKDLIEEENKKTPLSDQDIQDHFNKKGYQIARRTISKYRKLLKIPPAFLRVIP